MALNLMTPRYVAPDVTKAPLAGEALSSSRSRTNLARRAQSAREVQDAEGNAVRRAELGLKSEAQRVNLAGAAQAQEQAAALFPTKMLAAQEQAQGAALNNLATRQRIVENDATFGLRVDTMNADLDAKAAAIQIDKDNLTATRSQKTQEPEFSKWHNAASEIANRPDYGVDPDVKLPPIPDSLTGANRTRAMQMLEEWRTQMRQRKSFKAQESKAALVQRHSPDSPVTAETVRAANAEEAAQAAAAIGFVVPETNKEWWKAYMDGDGIFDGKSFVTAIQASRKTEATSVAKEDEAYGDFYDQMVTDIRAIDDGVYDIAGNTHKILKVARNLADWRFGRGKWKGKPMDQETKPTGPMVPKSTGTLSRGEDGMLNYTPSGTPAPLPEFTPPAPSDAVGGIHTEK